eukprot:9024990-Alexandrium_andersonii.AAC.1
MEMMLEWRLRDGETASANGMRARARWRRRRPWREPRHQPRLQGPSPRRSPGEGLGKGERESCLLYTSPSPRD